jgi:hypothetical protein
MRPDRSNYELWFTDWLDGRLDEKRAGDLEVFLSENPDLREELDGLALTYLVPAGIVYKKKKSLEKSAKNYSESQFEHLCIASLENDLTPAQRDELKEIIDQDKTKRKVFELYQNLKLKSSSSIFKRKSIVKKITAGERIFRWSIIGLSAAATVALLVAAFLSVTSDIKKTPQKAQALKQDTLLIELHSPLFMAEQILPDKNLPMSRTGNTASEAQVKKPATNPEEYADNTTPDSASAIKRQEVLLAMNVEAPLQMIKPFGVNENTLAASNAANIPQLTGERNNVQRFLAKVFHEKIMKDTAAVNRPVKSYDVAVAGITGLNKILGWDMALQKKPDEKGDIKSYYFTSRLLKFNAPVKKSAKSL